MTEYSISRRQVLAGGVALAASAAFGKVALAAGTYDVGASDTEILVGNTAPYSGPASAYGTYGKLYGNYFRMLNEAGGINGRKINYISYDDGYSPPKTVEQTRKLVEENQVLCTFGQFGSAPNSAVQKYLNAKKVPQVFCSAGIARFSDPEHFPWSIAWQPSYLTEGRIFGKYVLKELPNAKIAALVQNDDAGKDFLHGFKEALGDKAETMIIAEKTYEITAPTLDSEMTLLKDSGADVLYFFGLARATAQAIKTKYKIAWDAEFLLSSPGAYVNTALKPAGLEISKGIVTMLYFKDPSDPQWDKEADMIEYHAFMDKYYPEGDKGDLSNSFGYAIANTFHQVLVQCGDDLTRANVMKQAANLKDFVPGGLWPGITLNTTPADYAVIETMMPARFDGAKWAPFGEMTSGSLG